MDKQVIHSRKWTDCHQSTRSTGGQNNRPHGGGDAGAGGRVEITQQTWRENAPARISHVYEGRKTYRAQCPWGQHLETQTGSDERQK